jgi:hypothetical protein
VKWRSEIRNEICRLTLTSELGFTRIWSICGYPPSIDVIILLNDMESLLSCLGTKDQELYRFDTLETAAH